MIKVKIDGNIALKDALEENASYLTDGAKDLYFLPYWFEKTKDGYFMHQLGRLPEWLKKMITAKREGMLPLVEELMNQTFHCSDEEARPIVDKFVAKHPELLLEYTLEYLYSI